MDVVDFWQQQVAKWNTDLKCGFCWAFGAPLIESAVNVQQFEQEQSCCVHVLLLQDKQPAFTTNRTYNNQSGLITDVTCSTNFQLLVLMSADVGINNFNEIPEHDTDESKWAKVLNRLRECLACDAELDFCEFLGMAYRITTWSGTQVINFSDHNYSGYRINVSFQKVV